MEKPSFEKAMQRLEEIVDIMNQPTTSLDDSLKLYEEADVLMRVCETRIREVEQRVRELSEKRQVDFSDEENVISESSAE